VTTPTRLRGRRKSARNAGAVAIEFALLIALLPLPFLAFGIVDYGEVMAQATNLTAIIRGAAEYARGQVVRGKALPTAPDLQTLLGVPAEVFNTTPPSSFCTCAGSTDPQWNYKSVTCPGPGVDNPCAVIPGGDMRVLQYVAVSGSQTYTPIISGIWSFPGAVNARTVLRTQ
jgi:Flp pilus assembly protein TadG